MRQNVYASKIKRVLQLIIEMQTRPMFVHVIAKELEVTERTAYRYLAMFNELGFKLNRTMHGAYTLIQNDKNITYSHTTVANRTRPAKRIQLPKTKQ